METKQKSMSNSLKQDLGHGPTESTNHNSSNKTYVSVLHVDIKALSSMKGKDDLEQNISPSVTPVSDSGLGHSDGDRESKSSQFDSPEAKNSNNVLIKTTHLGLDVPEKTLSPDFCHFLERRSLTQIPMNKTRPPLSTPQKLKNDKEPTNNTGKKPLQWLDIHSDRKQKKPKHPKLAPSPDSKMTSRTGSNLSLQSKDDWMVIEKELRKYEGYGADSHEALYSILSQVTPASSRLRSRMDWQTLASSMGDESVPPGNDYFSVYPWSMKTKSDNNPLMDYIQQNTSGTPNTENREAETARGRPPRSKRNSGPIGVTYMQNARGFTKKVKSKTPGEVALEEARFQNSKKSKFEAVQIEVSIPRSKTSVSIPSLSKSSSLESLGYVDQNIRLPELPINGVNKGKIYSGIYRLATPPTVRQSTMTAASSVPSLQEELHKSMFPLQVKNCGIPNNDIHLYTHALKSFRSNSDLHKDKSYTLPVIYANRTNTASSKDSLSETFLVHPLSREHQARQQRIILQSVYGRESTEPPRPPPVTPNVKHSRTVMSAGEMASLLHKYNRPYHKRNPIPSGAPCSNTSSFVREKLKAKNSQSEFNPFNSDDDVDDDDREEVEDDSDEKSSIHSVSSMGYADGHPSC